MEPWHYEPAPDLELPAIERLRNFPREPDMFVYGVRVAAAVVIRGWLRLYHRLKIVGRENLPKGQSFVLVANHASHLDTLCLLFALPLARLHRAFPAAARDYFFVKVPRLIPAAIVVNALPFDRHLNVRHSLALCRTLLENPGNILVIFPEGTRSATGEIQEFKAGIGMLAAGTAHPILPCYLHRTHAAFPKGSWFPRPRQVQLIIGEPRVYSHLPCTSASAHTVSEDLREAVLALASATLSQSETPQAKEIAL
ncbi:MAG TPA: lysophospholipid acyltransferase family protein [Gemmataceae bacterium]|jgi:1-acyl-sn-glycerol-3-phosphate acyltransferase|nr:lysophospholipid acyltransferase family protein [Gemmataceae bacterium]